jgi:hypothetical protein
LLGDAIDRTKRLWTVSAWGVLPGRQPRPAKVIRLMAFFLAENPRFKNLSRKIIAILKKLLYLL